MAQKILRFTYNEATARMEVNQLGGRIIHQFSPFAFIAELPDNTNIDDLVASTDKPTEPLDEITQLAVTAWTTAQTVKLTLNTTGSSKSEGLLWDTPGFESPNGFSLAFTDTKRSTAESTGIPTSLYMIGSIAVGIVLVSRDTGIEAFTVNEQSKIIQEVQEGLDWLAGIEPRANISFIYDIRPITISSPPGPYAGETDPYEQFERDWRDAALKTMGYETGRIGYQNYTNDLRSKRHTDWAYVAFFTKYPLNHFAYAVGEKVVMNYLNDGWGPDNINRVFAHETCHIFGAADEYGSCSCGNISGYLRVPNNNCVNCFPPGSQIPCLMNANTLEMCDFTRRQIGWDKQLFHTKGMRYKDFSLQTGTVLHETDNSFTFAIATNRDLFAIKKSNTDTNSTEIFVLSAASNYQQFSLQIGTALHETGDTFAFVLASNRDLFAIKKKNTETNSTEVLILSAKSNYQQWSLQTGTALHETDDTYAFAIASNRDLFIIKRSGTVTNSTEVHILSAASNYQKWILQTKTALHETDNSFVFAVAPNRDLYTIKKSNTKTNSTEVHVLSAASNYQKLILQTGTAIHETDNSFYLGIASNSDLFAIKKSGTVSNSTEVHILKS